GTLCAAAVGILAGCGENENLAAGALPTATFTRIIGTLQSAISATSTCIEVADLSLFPAAGTIRIGDEKISYNGVTPGGSCTSGSSARAAAVAGGGTLNNLVRGVDGTTPAPHAAGSEIILLIIATPGPSATHTAGTPMATTTGSPATTRTGTPGPSVTGTAGTPVATTTGSPATTRTGTPGPSVTGTAGTPVATTTGS